MNRLIVKCVLSVVLSFAAISPVMADTLRLATFQIDVTPPLGTALCDGLVPDGVKVDDPLFARGIVILGAGEPIVLCAVDFVGIGNGGHDAWKAAVAEGAGTTPARVAVQSLHQHDAPGCDLEAEELLAMQGLSGKSCDVPFSRAALKRLTAVIKESLATTRPFTHIGIGAAKADRVASNRRILGDDGKVKIIRFSSTKEPEAIAAPEGVIDPEVKTISFWNQDTPLVAVTYYATHPQSHYGKGAISADFVGLARAIRDRDQKEVFHIHFNGASGNIAAGKYNDGSPQARVELTERLAAGMTQSFQNTKRTPVTSADVEWHIEPVTFPLSERLKKLEDSEKVLTNQGAMVSERVRAARDIVYAKRVTAGRTIELSSLRVGPAVVLNLPGESFIEYQLAAQKMRPDQFICTAAYGDYGPGYIGTTIAYSQGGYETSRVSRTAPEVEEVYLTAIRKVLNAK